MSRKIWSPEKIIADIKRLKSAHYDITQSRMEQTDSRLTSAAIRYFGSWKAAVEAAGINYEEVAALGRKRRVEKIKKWDKDAILKEIKRLHDAGEDLTSTMIRRKYLSLYATARRKEHFGSWADALKSAGIDYAAVKKASRKRRRDYVDWKEQLIKDARGESESRIQIRPVEARPSPLPRNWAQELIRERISELGEGDESETEELLRLESLMNNES